MFSHFDRQKDNFSNENIDREKTHLNYNLAVHQQMKQGDFIKQRCSEVRMQNRADVNVMCSWAVTAPKDLHEHEHEKFFKETYIFLENRYGKENVVSSWVHNDEVTPHMHFAFVPVVEDKKRDDYKVSAKEAINRKDLQTFHKDLSSHLERKLGHEVSILNEATKEGNRSIEELKRQSAKERLQEVTQEASRIVSKAQEEVKEIETSLTPLKAEYEAKKAYIRSCDEHTSMPIPDYAEIKKNHITKKEYIKVPKEKWIEKYVSANEKIYLENATEAFEKTISKHKNIQQMEDKIASLKSKVSVLELKNFKLESKMKSVEGRAEFAEYKVKSMSRRIYKVIRMFPEEIVNKFDKEWKTEKDRDKTLARMEQKQSKSNPKGIDR
jgi:hypothetical protein